MAYATQADIITIYSEDVLYVADRDGDGVADADAVTRALETASGEIDSLIGVRYPLPLVAPDPLLTQFCVDLAIYRLALSRDVLTDELRQRYEDTIKHLERIASGKAMLVMPGSNLDESGNAVPDQPRPIVSAGPPRVFTREKMKGL